jgi:hypothetical protein
MKDTYFIQILFRELIGILQIVFSLDVYGVREILGIQHGFKGFVDDQFLPIKVIFTFP